VRAELLEPSNAVEERSFEYYSLKCTAAVGDEQSV